MDRQAYLAALKAKLDGRVDDTEALEDADTVGDVLDLLSEEAWDAPSAMELLAGVVVDDFRQDEFFHAPMQWDS